MNLRDEGAAAVSTVKVRKTSLDKDLRKIERLEEATRAVSRNRLALGIAALFLATAGVLASSQIGASQNAVLMVVAAVIGGYMALTIGANDVANNVGPAVGARALTMTGALVIAAIFECAGALIAGGEVANWLDRLVHGGTVIDFVSLGIGPIRTGIFNVAGDGAMTVDATPDVVGLVARESGIALTELRTADGAGLEMFLQLTADTQREGKAA